MFLRLSDSVFMSRQCMFYRFTWCVCVCVAELELGLKRDALEAADGSSLEALLKAEPIDKKSGVSDLQGPEEDSAAVEPPATSATTHTSSGRVRKVQLKAGSTLPFSTNAIPIQYNLWIKQSFDHSDRISFNETGLSCMTMSLLQQSTNNRDGFKLYYKSSSSQ